MEMGREKIWKSEFNPPSSPPPTSTSHLQFGTWEYYFNSLSNILSTFFIFLLVYDMLQVSGS